MEHGTEGEVEPHEEREARGEDEVEEKQEAGSHVEVAEEDKEEVEETEDEEAVVQAEAGPLEVGATLPLTLRLPAPLPRLHALPTRQVCCPTRAACRLSTRMR